MSFLHLAKLCLLSPLLVGAGAFAMSVEEEIELGKQEHAKIIGKFITITIYFGELIFVGINKINVIRFVISRFFSLSIVEFAFQSAGGFGVIG